MKKERQTEAAGFEHGRDVASVVGHRRYTQPLSGNPDTGMTETGTERQNQTRRPTQGGRNKSTPLMQIGEIFALHKQSPVLALLRQRNLPFALACLQRAFAEISMDDVTEPQLKSAIMEVQNELFEQGESERFDRDPQHYIDEWSRVSTSPELDRPWLSTRMSPTGTKLFCLLPSAADVLAFIEGLEVSKEFLTNSSLNSFVSNVLKDASVLSGDKDHQRKVLDAQIAELKAKRDALDENGVQDVDDFGRAEIANSLVSQMNQILGDFWTIPSRMRKHSSENRELYHTFDGPKHEILMMVSDRNKEKRASPEYRVVSTLYGMRRDKTLKSDIENSLEIIIDKCRDHLSVRQIARLRRFMTELSAQGHELYREDARITKDQRDFIKSDRFRDLREESAALRDVQACINRIRDELEPAINDRRLTHVGLSISAPMKFPSMGDIKLASQIPDRKIMRETAPEVTDPADLAAIEDTKEKARKGAYLSVVEARVRIKKAMGSADSVSLSELIEVFPLRYGAEEISNYLSLAGGSLPSRYDIGSFGTAVVSEGVKLKMLTFPNPRFLRSGASAQGIDSFLEHIGGDLSKIAVAPSLTAAEQ